MCARVCVLAALLAAAGAVEVQRIAVPYEQDFSLVVNSSIEYILDYTPSAEQAQWPARVSLRAEGGGGDVAAPALLTARQPLGAQTWHLPYASPSGEQTLFELERTLCFNQTEQDAGGAPGAWSLHVSAAGARGVALSARAAPARDWRLSFAQQAQFTVTPTAPRILYYAWQAEQRSVRLRVASPDALCATVAVQTYACPMPESLEAVSSGGLRMTALSSAAAQVSRSAFPHGFYVVVVVHETEAACSGAAPPGGDDWLWGAATGARPAEPPPPPPPRERRKTVLVSFQPSLTLAQYAVATSVTLAVLLSFYVAFGALVLAQRAPAFRRLVEPRAVLRAAPVTDGTTAEEGAPGLRRRHDSTETLDSLDDDSESDEGSRPAAKREITPHGQNGSSPALPTADTVQVAASPDRAAISPAPAGAEPAPPAPPAPAAAAGVTFSDDVTAPAASQDNNINDNGRQGAAAAAAAAPPPLPQPFGLPAQVSVATLARRRAGTLRARSARYRQLLWTVAVFYALPVLQFVIAFQVVLYVSGSLDLCYYNFLCAHPAGALSDFNHVLSNAGYLLLGALFLLQLRRRQARRRHRPKDEEYGLPAHYGVLQALGGAMMMVALLSAAYHVCPNHLNFQFDTAFMYVLAVLVMVKLYQARHPDINVRAHVTFAALALIIALVVWGVLGGGALFWALFSVLHVFAVLLLSLRAFYFNQFRLERGAGLAAAARGLRGGARGARRPQLVLLAVANVLNWAYAIYGLWTRPVDFAGHMLTLLLGNALLHLVGYLALKLLHGERLRWYAWAFSAAAALSWAPALYFFLTGASSWSSTAAESRQLNRECLLLQFYDTHDLWHLLSAAALYFSANALLTWDDGLSAVRRDAIAVF